VYLHEVCDKRHNLDGLAEAHFISEHSRQPIVVQRHEPLEALHLVSTQCATNQGVRLRSHLLLLRVRHMVVGGLVLHEGLDIDLMRVADISSLKVDSIVIFILLHLIIWVLALHLVCSVLLLYLDLLAMTQSSVKLIYNRLEDCVKPTINRLERPDPGQPIQLSPSAPTPFQTHEHVQSVSQCTEIWQAGTWKRMKQRAA